MKSRESVACASEREVDSMGHCVTRVSVLDFQTLVMTLAINDSLNTVTQQLRFYTSNSGRLVFSVVLVLKPPGLCLVAPKDIHFQNYYLIDTVKNNVCFITAFYKISFCSLLLLF